METSLVIKGVQDKDLREVLNIAIVEGMKKLRARHADDVHVSPFTYAYKDGVVVVVGCNNASVVGGKEKQDRK